MHSLEPPPSVATDPKSREIARIWAAHGSQHVTLDPHLWDEPAYWGIMLVDLARHVANAYAELRGTDTDATLDRIKAGFDAEWFNPTDEAKGSI